MLHKVIPTVVVIVLFVAGVVFAQTEPIIPNQLTTKWRGVAADNLYVEGIFVVDSLNQRAREQTTNSSTGVRDDSLRLCGPNNLPNLQFEVLCDSSPDSCSCDIVLEECTLYNIDEINKIPGNYQGKEYFAGTWCDVWVKNLPMFNVVVNLYWNKNILMGFSIPGVANVTFIDFQPGEPDPIYWIPPLECTDPEMTKDPSLAEKVRALLKKN